MNQQGKTLMTIAENMTKALHVKTELSLLFKKKSKIKGIVNYRTMFKSYSELSQGNYTKKESLKSFLSLFKMSNNILKNPISRIGNPNASVIFINGICSSLDIAKYQTTVLSELLNRDVELIHNKTDGLLVDLFECTQDRMKNETSKASLETATIILEKVANNEEVIIIGYSQGTIITSKAVEIVNRVLDEKSKKKIKVFNFASAAKNYKVNGIHTEHFINEEDPICHIGYIEHRNDIDGNAFYKKASGHLLIADYIAQIAYFKNIENSEFFNLIK